MRTCRKCNESKPLVEFVKNVKGRKDPYTFTCKPCKNLTYRGRYNSELRAQRARKWKADNPERAARLRRRATWKNYGMNPDDAEALWNAHDGKCGLCKEEITGQFNVDHCHTTNKVREILCSRCNMGLGAFEDSPRLLILAIGYLNKHME